MTIGSGKTYKTFQMQCEGRIFGKKMLQSRDIDMMMSDQVNMDSKQIKALVDAVWNKAQDKMHTHAVPRVNYRGRLIGEQDTELYWAYSHGAPKPMLQITHSKSEQDQFWSFITEGKGGKFRKMKEGLLMDDAIRNSEMAQAAESDKEVN